MNEFLNSQRYLGKINDNNNNSNNDNNNIGNKLLIMILIITRNSKIWNIKYDELINKFQNFVVKETYFLLISGYVSAIYAVFGILYSIIMIGINILYVPLYDNRQNCSVCSLLIILFQRFLQISL